MKNDNTNLAQKQEEPLNFNEIKTKSRQEWEIRLTVQQQDDLAKSKMDDAGERLYMRFLSYINSQKNECNPSFEKLLSRLPGWSLSKLKRNLKRLNQIGAIDIITPKNRLLSNRYIIHLPGEFNGTGKRQDERENTGAEYGDKGGRPAWKNQETGGGRFKSEPSENEEGGRFKSDPMTVQICSDDGSNLNRKIFTLNNHIEKDIAVCDTNVVHDETPDSVFRDTTHTNEFINISFEELKDILYHERLIELAMSVWNKNHFQWDSKQQFIETLKNFREERPHPDILLKTLHDYSIGKNKPPEHLLAAFRRLSTEIQTNSRDKKFVDFDTKCNELWGKPTWKIKEELEVEKQEKALLSEFHKNLTGLKDEDKEAFFNDFIDQGWSYVKEDPVYLEIKNASDEYYSLKEILYGIERRYEVFQKVLSGNMDDVYFYTHWLNNPLETDDIQDERMTEMKSWIEGYEQRIKREQEEQEERKKREIEEKQRKENEIKESIIKEILHEYDRMKAGEMAEDYLYQNIDIPKDLFTDERIKPVIRWHDSFRQKVLDQQIKQIMESKRVNH